MALTDGLISFWKLSDVNDSVGINHLTNMNSVSFVSGKLGNAADFGASNTTKHLKIDSELGLTSTTARTMSCWVKLNTEITAGTYTFLGQSIQGANWAQFRIEYEHNWGTIRLVAGVNGGGGYQRVTTNISLGTTNWYHLVLNFVGGTTGAISLTVNGTTYSGVNATIAGTAVFTSSVQIGALTNNLHASAIIDDAGIWDRVLTSTEITQLYNGGVGLTYPFTTSNTSNFFNFFN